MTPWSRNCWRTSIGSAGSQGLLERRPLLIVQIDDLDAIDAEQLQGALHAPLDRLAGVVVVLWITPLLGLQERVLRQPAALAQDETDAPLALAVAVEGGGVDVGDRAVEGGADGGQRILFRHPIAERLWHVADRRATDGDGRDHEPGLPERFAGERIGGGRGHGRLLPDQANLNRRMLSERSRRGNGGCGPLHLGMHPCRGGEMADTPALGAGGRKAVRVRIPLPAPVVHGVRSGPEFR